MEKNNLIHQTYIQNILSKTNMNVVSKQSINIINHNDINDTEIRTQTQTQTQTQITQFNNNILINEIIKRIFPCFK